MKRKPKAFSRTIVIQSDDPGMVSAFMARVIAEANNPDLSADKLAKHDHEKSRAISPLSQKLSLAVQQHIVSRKHIEWFCDARNRVYALKVGDPHFKRLAPSSPHFCAERIWSNNAERWMGDIERRFYRAVDASKRTGIVDDSSQPDQPRNNREGYFQRLSDQQACTEYWALCRARSTINATPPQAFHLTNYPRPKSEADLSQEDKDQLDYNGITAYTQHGDETRGVAEVLIRQWMDGDIHHLNAEKRKWRLCSTSENNVVLPDYFATTDIPLAPNLFLHAEDWGETIPDLCHCSNANDVMRTISDRARLFVVGRSPGALKRYRS